MLCQRFRELVSNRKEARKILKEKLDLMINQDLSKLGKRVAKKQKQKAKARQRANKKAKAKGGEGQSVASVVDGEVNNEEETSDDEGSDEESEDNEEPSDEASGAVERKDASGTPEAHPTTSRPPS
ncbi:hypothetical protein HDV00_008413 [Rhizophlyctis rosea]|nr:hypothetical protein HDV00_008413 [Rhizophlyctis rosea]